MCPSAFLTPYEPACESSNALRTKTQLASLLKVVLQSAPR
jgi:hypothetical protein